MAYYTKVLQPGENVRYVGGLHWIIYKHSIVFGVLTVIALVIYLDQSAGQWPIALLAAIIFLLLGIISFVRSWFVHVTTEIVVTDKRVIYKVGWIARRTEEMSVTKVETVDVNQGIAGRILGFGTILIRGTGGSWEPLRHVAAPLALRNAVIVG
ncbi:MAG: PH domain-containing protein [Acetobacteraceae bacterium]